MIENRLRLVMEYQLSEAQMGFRQGRGCTDAIFALRQMIENGIEHDERLEEAYLDQVKAFDKSQSRLAMGSIAKIWHQ